MLFTDCIDVNETGLFRTQFVNISGDAVFYLRKSRNIFTDVFFPFYTEVYRLQPRRMILYISKSGEARIQDKSYENRVTIKGDDDTVIIDICDIRMEDAGLYSVEIPRKHANNCFKVYVLGKLSRFITISILLTKTKHTAEVHGKVIRDNDN